MGISLVGATAKAVADPMPVLSRLGSAARQPAVLLGLGSLAVADLLTRADRAGRWP